MGKQPQATHKRLQDDRPRSHEDASWKKRVHDEDANTSGRDAKRRRSHSSERRQRRSSSHSAERVDEVSRCLWRNDQHGSVRHSSRQQERNSPSDREQQPAELRHPTDWRQHRETASLHRLAHDHPGFFQQRHPESNHTVSRGNWHVPSDRPW